MYAPVCWKTHPDRIEVQHCCKVRQTTCSNSLDDKQCFRTCYDHMELQKKIVNKETNFMTQRVFHMIEFLSLNLQAPYVNFVLTFTSTFNAGANWIAWTQRYPSEVCPSFHSSAWCNKTKMLKDTSYVNSFLTHISNSLLNSGNSLKCSFWFQCSDTKLEITLLL